MGWVENILGRGGKKIKAWRGLSKHFVWIRDYLKVIRRK